MAYFINVVRGNHKEGTKFYDIYALVISDEPNNGSLSNSTKPAPTVIIQNWGKISYNRKTVTYLSGKQKLTYAKNTKIAATLYNRIKKSKESRGYLFDVGERIFTSEDRSEFIARIRQFHLDEEDFQRIYNNLFPESHPESKVENNHSHEKPEEKTIERIIISDPLWGTW